MLLTLLFLEERVGVLRIVMASLLPLSHKCINFSRYTCSVCNFNRHYAEHSTYFTETTFLDDSVDELETNNEIKFYDSNTGKLLFMAPKGRTWDEFVRESKAHGWRASVMPK